MHVGANLQRDERCICIIPTHQLKIFDVDPPHPSKGHTSTSTTGAQSDSHYAAADGRIVSHMSATSRL